MAEIKPEQVPENVWCEVALRLEAYGVNVTDRIAKVVAAEAINAWPGMWDSTGKMAGHWYKPAIILPLTPSEPE